MVEGLAEIEKRFGNRLERWPVPDTGKGYLVEVEYEDRRTTASEEYLFEETGQCAVWRAVSTEDGSDE